MADYYTYFSAMFDLPIQHKELVDQLLENKLDPFEVIDWESADEITPGFCYKWELDHGRQLACLWIYAEEGDDNVTNVATFVCYIQKRFQLEEPWGMEWSNSCSKPRLDAFGGGAVVCHLGKAKWNTTGGWMDKEMIKATRKMDKANAQGK